VNARIEEGDGSLGGTSVAPYASVLIATPAVPRALIDPFAKGGRLVIIVGSTQNLELLRIAVAVAPGVNSTQCQALQAAMRLLPYRMPRLDDRLRPFELVVCGGSKALMKRSGNFA
jgi:protein-L-isoaspartate O-methyltransferase